MQLHEVERVHTEVRTRTVRPGTEVVEGVVLRLLRHAAAHLRGDEEVRVRAFAQIAADELLAAPVAVHVGGVEEGHAAVDGGVQHGERVLLLDLAPVGTQLPGAESDDGYLLVDPADYPLFHGDLFQWCPWGSVRCRVSSIGPEKIARPTEDPARIHEPAFSMSPVSAARGCGPTAGPAVR